MNYQKKINVGKDFHHDSASLQVSGEAIYIDDMIKNSELMHASLVTSDIIYETISVSYTHLTLPTIISV